MANKPATGAAFETTSPVNPPIHTRGLRFNSPFLPPQQQQKNQQDQRIKTHEGSPTEKDGNTTPSLPNNTAKDNSETITETKTHTALIILNSPIPTPPGPIFDRLWDQAEYRVCADGGANRLHDATVTDTDTDIERQYVPDLIRGDLDSLRSDVSSFYQSKNVTVQRVSDQNSTDLDKAITAVLHRFAPPSSSSSLSLSSSSPPDSENDHHDQRRGTTIIYAYGAFGGRFDHEMSAIGALYHWYPSCRLVLYDEENCAFLLPPDVDNEIHLPSFVSDPQHGVIVTNDDGGGDNTVKDAPHPVIIGEGPTCGLIPIGGRCDVVETTGLQWDLDGSTPLEFGGLVSTSNRVVGDVVAVRSSHPLVFTAEMRCSARRER